jgi:hypothetical protein
MGAGQEQGAGTVYYRFADAKGTVHVVDSIDGVPYALRGRAQRVEYEAQPAASALRLPSSLTRWQTFGLGFAAALVVVFLFKRLPKTMRLVLRFAIVGAVAALLVSAYLGWMRRSTGASTDALATPGALLEDARSAVAKMNARVQAEQAEIKEAEQAK